MSLLSLFACGSPKPSFYDQDPVSYEYSYNATMAYPIKWFSVKAGDDGILLKYSDGDNEIRVYRAPEDVFARIGEIVRTTKLYKLQESYRPAMQVLDGYRWSLEILYPDDSIYSHGSNARPSSDLREGIEKINEYLESIVEAAGDEGVIATETHR